MRSIERLSRRSREKQKVRVLLFCATALQRQYSRRGYILYPMWVSSYRARGAGSIARVMEKKYRGAMNEVAIQSIGWLSAGTLLVTLITQIVGQWRDHTSKGV